MLYGRLADPDSTLGTDPRSDPRMVAALASVGLDGRLAQPEVTVDAPLEDRLAFVTETEEAIGAVLEEFARSAPVVEGVTTTTATITGGGGKDITLFISRPDNVEGALPCVVHTHGGGMAFLSAADTMYQRWREFLAATGLLVVGVEFRNAGGKLGPHPYPAGLNDCVAAVQWIAASRSELGVSHLIVSGESGGGNLTLAVAHKAKRDGWIAEIAGVYALCPFISNRWLEQPDELPSLTENEDYFFSNLAMALIGSVYDPGEAHAHDAACWPLEATEEELRGLPPHVISINELDPLRDEGLIYYRRLVHAGVPAIGRTVAGTCHAGDLIMPGVLPELYEASLRDVSGFAKSLV